MMNKYNKLVRDKIPDIILSHGETPLTRILNDDEYKEFLNNKLLEEVDEYLKSGELEELSDVLEVIRAISKVKGYTFEDVLNIMEEKKSKRGGFDEKIFLIEVANQKSK